MTVIDLAQSYSPYPAGRFPDDGMHNGQRFRTEFLVPALREAVANDDMVIIDIDGVRSFGSSFLEEAFAGLIRRRLFTREVVMARIRIRSHKSHLTFYKKMIENLISNAQPEDVF